MDRAKILVNTYINYSISIMLDQTNNNSMLENVLKALEQGFKLCQDVLKDEIIKAKIEKYQEDCMTIMFSNHSSVVKKSDALIVTSKTPPKYTVLASKPPSADKFIARNWAKQGKAYHHSQSSYSIKYKPTFPIQKGSSDKKETLSRNSNKEPKRGSHSIFFPLTSPKKSLQSSHLAVRRKDSSKDTDPHAENQGEKISRSKNLGIFKIKAGKASMTPRESHKGNEIQSLKLSALQKKEGETSSKDVAIRHHATRTKDKKNSGTQSSQTYSIDESNMSTSRRHQMVLDNLRMQEREIAILKNAKEAQDQGIKNLMATLQNLMRPAHANHGLLGNLEITSWLSKWSEPRV